MRKFYSINSEISARKIECKILLNWDPTLEAWAEPTHQRPTWGQPPSSPPRTGHASAVALVAYNRLQLYSLYSKITVSQTQENYISGLLWAKKWSVWTERLALILDIISSRLIPQ